MHPRNQAVAADLAKAGIGAQIEILDAGAHTAKAAADFLGTAVGAIANSLIFAADSRIILVMTSGAHRVDTDFLAKQLGFETIGRATPEQVLAATGQKIGGVAPCGHPHPVETYVDSALRGFEKLWAAAGTPNSLFPLTFDELVSLTKGEIVDVEP